MSPKVLDASEPVKVEYCIPLWMRDEHVKLSIARSLGRIQPSYEPRPEPVAVVCFGPSLADTWEQVRDFPFVISCSGSHRFLVERGITPTWHVEVDPRAHKVQLIGPPCAGTHYLIASCCHPAVFDHLTDNRVSLWHVFATDAEAKRILPRGEWALTGGSSVGLRALSIANFLGFRDLHVFGMDGSEGKTGKHAAEHPNQPKDYALTTYDGIEYRTTSSMLHCARETWHELDQMGSEVTATFYGDGLVQHMARNYRPNPVAKGKAIIGITQPELISAEYAGLNAELHRSNPLYGVGGARHAETVKKLAASLSTTSVLDYGCGKGRLAHSLPYPIWEYDPAIPGKTASPRPADLVVCTDVLEHIEPEMLRFVLDDLRRCVVKMGYFVIHMGPASKTLPDGRNTHLIQQDASWWKHKLKKFFAVSYLKAVGPELHVVVTPKVAAMPVQQQGAA